MGERVAHARGLFSRKGAKDAKVFYGVLDLAVLAAWRETLMIHARDFCSRKGAKGAKEFLRNAGLGGLGGLARDSSRGFFVLAKARRTQRIPMECRTWRTWRLDERWFTQIFCSRKGAEVAKDSYGVQGLAAWRETLMIKRDNFCSRKGAENAKDSYGMQDLADLAAWRETLMIHARGLLSRKGAEDAKDSYGMQDLADLAA